MSIFRFNAIFLCFSSISFFYSQKSVNVSYTLSLKSSKSILQETDSTNFGKILHKNLVDNLFPYWYGTQWDFNGYTNTPKNGVIACGYFVSTTLKHIGFNLNRYDIAKMYSSKIVRVLCNADYEIFEDLELFLRKMEQKQDGVYILGLSNHVGFIEVNNGIPYFIHSDYLGDEGVKKEEASKSLALENSGIFWIGNFSNNPRTYSRYKNQKEYERTYE